MKQFSYLNSTPTFILQQQTFHSGLRITIGHAYPLENHYRRFYIGSMKKPLTLTILLFSLFSGGLCAEDCPGSQESHWTNCVGVSTDSYGNQYIGEWKDGRKDGQGTFTLVSGSEYIGEWKNDQPHGQGTLTWSDGRIQKGIWVNGKYLGK